MRDPDSLMLAWGMLRVFLWMGGAIMAWQYKNYAACIGCVLYSIVSAPRAINEAGFHEELWILEVSSFLTTVATLCIVSGIAWTWRTNRTAKRVLDNVGELERDGDEPSLS